jgi:F-type H+-transporting ATPase subunit alpha
VLIVYAATNGYIDELPVESVGKYESGLFEYVESKHPDLLALIREKGALSDDVKAKLNSVLGEFKDRFTA